MFARMVVVYIQLMLVKTTSHNDLIIPSSLQEMRIFIFLIYLLTSAVCVAKVGGQVVVSVGETS